MTETRNLEMPEQVHEWFGLSYANYAVLHRTLLQSMPAEWQGRFVQCMRELDDAYAHLDAPDFNVATGEWRCPFDVPDDKLAELGWVYSENGEEISDPNGNLHSVYQACVFVPCADPVPSYDRGRAYMPPATTPAGGG